MGLDMAPYIYRYAGPTPGLDAALYIHICLSNPVVRHGPTCIYYIHICACLILGLDMDPYIHIYIHFSNRGGRDCCYGDLGFVSIYLRGLFLNTTRTR